MVDDKQVTSEEASVLRKEAAEASIERDVAVYTAVRASGREAAAIEDAKEQHVATLRAQAETAHMNTLRHVANVRANSEARGGDRARFALYLLAGIVLVAFAVVVVWLST